MNPFCGLCEACCSTSMRREATITLFYELQNLADPILAAWRFWDGRDGAARRPGHISERGAFLRRRCIDDEWNFGADEYRAQLDGLRRGRNDHAGREHHAGQHASL